MSILLSGLVVALVGFLIVGAASTIRDPRRIQILLDLLGISPRLAPAAPAMEVFIAVMLVWVPRFGAMVGAAYVLAITAWLAVVSARGTYVEDCGCFRKPHAVDRAFFIRNALLIVSLATVALTGPELPLLVKYVVTLAVLAGVVTAAVTRRRSVDLESVDVG